MMRGNLAVRINDGYTDRVVTRATRRLRFRKTAPGGHADASCVIDLPISEFPNLGPTDRFYVSDARTARVLFDGYTTNPGSTSGRDGQSFDLTALGGQSRLSDQADRLIYVDRDIASFTSAVPGQKPGAAAQIGQFPKGSGAYEGEQCLYLQFPMGALVGTNDQVALRYDKFVGSSMTLGGFLCIYDGGNSSAQYSVDWYAEPYIAGDPVAHTDLYTGAGAIAMRAGDAFMKAGRQYLTFRLMYLGGGTTIGTDTIWAGSGRTAVVGHLWDRNGVPRDMTTLAHFDTTNINAWVYAHEVVEDLLGRSLPWCDPATAVVETTTYAIDNLAFLEGATPAQVLEALAGFEADMLWEIGESNSAGRHRFAYRAWPTTPRYLIPASMPVDRPGGDDDLCNRIKVSWTDSDGNPQTTIVTSTVEALDRVDRVRDADPVTLPPGRGSAANAQRLGEQILAAKARPPRSGTCVIDRPIVDLMTGGMAMPWELEPGYLALDAATGESLRVTEMEYDDDPCTATLTLGEPSPSNEQRIARLEKVVS